VTEPRFQGRRIAIFGATSGIATAAARIYAEAGARLVLVARDEAAMAAVADDLRVRGGEALSVRADFRSMEGASAAVESAWTAFGGLDTAVVAIGSLPDQAIAQDDPDALEEAVRINFTVPAALSGDLAARFAAQQGGALAVITSVAGERGRRSNYVYGAAKGGLQRFLEGLRHRHVQAGVTVLDVRPGFVITKMTAGLTRKGPLWAEPRVVADSIVAALEKRRSVLRTPWFWWPIITIVKMLPRPLFHRTSL
jgi:decaprenylphospho-beta-D-erythro-pentofuranosid-2-ulose 2-reductase